MMRGWTNDNILLGARGLGSLEKSLWFLWSGKQSSQLNISAGRQQGGSISTCCLPADMLYCELCFPDHKNQAFSKMFYWLLFFIVFFKRKIRKLGALVYYFHMECKIEAIYLVQGAEMKDLLNLDLTRYESQTKTA